MTESITIEDGLIVKLSFADDGVRATELEPNETMDACQ